MGNHHECEPQRNTRTQRGGGDDHDGIYHNDTTTQRYDDGTTRFNETPLSTRNGRRTAGVTAKGRKDAKTGDYDDGIYHEVAVVNGGNGD